MQENEYKYGVWGWMMCAEIFEKGYTGVHRVRGLFED